MKKQNVNSEVNYSNNVHNTSNDKRITTLIGNGASDLNEETFDGR